MLSAIGKSCKKKAQIVEKVQNIEFKEDAFPNKNLSLIKLIKEVPKEAEPVSIYRIEDAIDIPAPKPESILPQKLKKDNTSKSQVIVFFDIFN